MRSLDECLEQAAKGKSIRSGIILGVRMTLAGLKMLNLNETVECPKSLVTIVETDRCLPDAVQIVTGCRLGNRRLKFKDLGKMAATFVDLEMLTAVRVAARESASLHAVVFPNFDREEALKKSYRILSDEELFTQEAGKVTLSPEELPGFSVPRVICARCGEGIGFGKYMVKEGLVLCRSCAGSCYFEPSELPSSSN